MTKDEVLAANAAFYRAFERKDIDIMSTVWSQGTGSFCIHPGSHILQGWKEESAPLGSRYLKTPLISK